VWLWPAMGVLYRQRDQPRPAHQPLLRPAAGAVPDAGPSFGLPRRVEPLRLLQREFGEPCRPASDGAGAPRASGRGHGTRPRANRLLVPLPADWAVHAGHWNPGRRLSKLEIAVMAPPAQARIWSISRSG